MGKTGTDSTETRKIVVDERDGFVGLSVTGLDFMAATAMIEKALAEAHKLLSARARMRRFRHPLIYRSFNSRGRVMMKHDKSGWSLTGRERGMRNSVELEDCRGRKTFIRVEIAR